MADDMAGDFEWKPTACILCECNCGVEVRLAPDGRHFEHADGTPFLWFADTWWMGLTQRLRWPDDFQISSVVLPSPAPMMSTWLLPTNPGLKP